MTSDGVSHAPTPCGTSLRKPRASGAFCCSERGPPASFAASSVSSPLAGPVRPRSDTYASDLPSLHLTTMKHAAFSSRHGPRRRESALAHWLHSILAEGGRPERHCRGDGSLCVLAWGMSTQRAASRSPIGEAGDGTVVPRLRPYDLLSHARVAGDAGARSNIKVRTSLNVASVSGTSGL